MYGTETIETLCKLEQSSSLQQMTDLGYELLGNPVFFQDIELSIPFYTKCIQVNHPDWQNDVVNGTLSVEKIMYHMGIIDLTKRFLDQREPIWLEPNPNHNRSERSLAYPLVYNKMLLGMLILTNNLKEIQEEDKLLFQLLGKMFLSKLVHNVELNTTGKSLTESIILKLLDGYPLSREFVMERVRRMQWNPCRYLWVITIWAKPSKDNRQRALEPVIELLSRDSRHKLVRYQSSLVYLYSSDKPDFRFGVGDNGLLQLMGNQNLVAGVSRRFENLMELRDYYGQCVKALEIGMTLEIDRALFFFDDLAPYCVLRQWQDDGLELDDLVHSALVQLQKHDRDNGSELFTTLQAFLECGLDAGRTAEKLFIHKNTVRYRLQQCESLFPLDLNDGESLFGYMFSMRAIALQAKIRQSGGIRSKSLLQEL